MVDTLPTLATFLVINRKSGSISLEELLQRCCCGQQVAFTPKTYILTAELLCSSNAEAARQGVLANAQQIKERDGYEVRNCFRFGWGIGISGSGSGMGNRGDR